jgi:hypothetical protein
MIRTEEWYHKKVKIATGPLQGRVGLVEKWGNGWITVSIPGVGFHNRRSFELYLHDAMEEDEADVKRQEDVPRDKPRAAVSPSPSHGSAKSREGAITPKIVASAVDLTSPKPFGPRQLPDMIPETPRPVVEGQRETAEVPPETPAVPVLSAATQGGAEALPKVTPHAEKETYMPEGQDDVPLGETLQFGGLDMLFGTAALERSRRTPQQPTRYEDTAMLKKILAKKGRKISLEPDHGKTESNEESGRAGTIE